jgi:hypothetical protein
MFEARHRSTLEAKIGRDLQGNLAIERDLVREKHLSESSLSQQRPELEVSYSSSQLRDSGAERL